MRKADYLKPLPANYLSLCKREIAEARMGKITFDYAIPQVWLDAYVGKNAGDSDTKREWLYESIICACVTAYPPGNFFGEIVNLVTGDILNS